jgi:hypothetical protein
MLVAHRCRARHLGNQPRGFNLVGRVCDANRAIRNYGFVVAVSGVKLAQVLGDQVGFDSVACGLRERTLEEIEPPERWKFVQHQQQAPQRRYVVV